jgi:hypothetical protein
VRVVHDLGVIVKDVLVPALKDFSVILAPVVLLLDHLDSITGFVADHSTAFHVALDLVVGSLLVYKGLMIAMAAAGGVLAMYDAITDISRIKTLAFRDATNAQRLAIVAWKLAVWAATGAQWLWNAAMDANPVGLVILAVAGLATGFYLAYTKIKPFRDFINGLWADMRGFYDWLTAVWNPAQWSSGPGATTQTIDPSRVGGATGVVAQSGGTAAHPGPLISLMGHASGGTMTQTHTAWVGEKGPELLTLPRGSSVIPLPRVPEFAGGRHIEIPVVLNGREIARAVYDDMDDRMARR